MEVEAERVANCALSHGSAIYQVTEKSTLGCEVGEVGRGWGVKGVTPNEKEQSHSHGPVVMWLREYFFGLTRPSCGKSFLLRQGYVWVGGDGDLILGLSDGRSTIHTHTHALQTD